MRKALLAILMILLLLTPTAAAGPVEDIKSLLRGIVEGAKDNFVIGLLALLAVSIILLILVIILLVIGQRNWAIRLGMWTAILWVITATLFYIVGYFAKGGGGNPAESLVYTLARELKEAIDRAISSLGG